MKMNLSADRQGYLRDLHLKSVGELKELLQRQENLLSQRNFLENFEDKGEKCRKFAEELRTLISMKVDDINRTNKTKSSGQIKAPLKEKNIHVHETVSDFESGSLTSNEGNTNNSADDSNDLVSNLQNLSLGSEKINTQNRQYTSQNAYEKVIKKEAHTECKKDRFMPSRTLKDEPDLASTLRSHPPLRPPKPSLKQPIPEESNVRPPDYKYKQTKMISIEESVQLINQQRDKAEKLSAENAAKRLASHLVPKMSAYKGAEEMTYRQPTSTELEDSDDDDDDYADDDNEEAIESY